MGETYSSSVTKRLQQQQQQQQQQILYYQWCPCEQNNHIIHLYTMTTIICVWFKTYMTNTDKWHELVQYFQISNISSG
jgi:hypothetical protein